MVFTLITLAVYCQPQKNASEVAYVNKQISLEVKQGRTELEAFQIIQRTMLSYFDVLESSDKNAQYFRTAWVGSKGLAGKKGVSRIRVIISKNSENPLSYRMKFNAERAPKGTAYENDTKFEPWNFIPRKYEEFYNEMVQSLKN